MTSPAIASSSPDTHAGVVTRRLLEAGISPSAADIATLAAGYGVLIEWRSIVAELARSDDEPILRVSEPPSR